MCQWTNDNRGSTGRNTQLKQYAASKGLTWQDEDTQIEFFLTEIGASDIASGYATYQFMANKGYSKTAWENATSVSEATAAFMWTFERPGSSYGSSSLSTRITYAEEYYEQFKDAERPTTDSRIGTISLSNSSDAAAMLAMLTEALRIADDDTYYYSQTNRDGEYSYDCSSFVYRLYNKYFSGMSSLATNTRGDYSSLAVKIITLSGSDTTELQPGDVLWRTGHVAIYLGNGQYVHASSESLGILVSTYRGNFTKAYRYVE